MHELLHKICRHLPTDFEPYGQRKRNADDCSKAAQNSALGAHTTAHTGRYVHRHVPLRRVLAG